MVYFPHFTFAETLEGLVHFKVSVSTWLVPQQLLPLKYRTRVFCQHSASWISKYLQQRDMEGSKARSYLRLQACGEPPVWTMASPTLRAERA